MTVIERDALPPLGEPRKGVPQGKHAHVLLSHGRDVSLGLGDAVAVGRRDAVTLGVQVDATTSATVVPCGPPEMFERFSRVWCWCSVPTNTEIATAAAFMRTACSAVRIRPSLSISGSRIELPPEALSTMPTPRSRGLMLAVKTPGLSISESM